MKRSASEPGLSQPFKLFVFHMEEYASENEVREKKKSRKKKAPSQKGM